MKQVSTRPVVPEIPGSFRSISSLWMDICLSRTDNHESLPVSAAMVPNSVVQSSLQKRLEIQSETWKERISTMALMDISKDLPRPESPGDDNVDDNFG